MAKLKLGKLVKLNPVRTIQKIRVALWPDNGPNLFSETGKAGAVAAILESEGYGREKPGIAPNTPKTTRTGAVVEFTDSNTAEAVFKNKSDAEGVVQFLAENEALSLTDCDVIPDDDEVRWLARVVISDAQSEVDQVFDRGYVLAALGAWHTATEGE